MAISIGCTIGTLLGVAVIRWRSVTSWWARILADDVFLPCPLHSVHRTWGACSNDPMRRHTDPARGGRRRVLWLVRAMWPMILQKMLWMPELD